MRNVIGAINGNPEIHTLASCCGHGRYPMSIVVEEMDSGYIYELVSGKAIPRKSRFYKADSDGYYYIPEISYPQDG